MSNNYLFYTLEKQQLMECINKNTPIIYKTSPLSKTLTLDLVKKCNHYLCKSFDQGSSTTIFSQNPVCNKISKYNICTSIISTTKPKHVMIQSSLYIGYNAKESLEMKYLNLFHQFLDYPNLKNAKEYNLYDVILASLLSRPIKKPDLSPYYKGVKFE